MSGHGSNSGHGHGGLGAYFVVFTALMVFTGLTVWAAYQHLGIWNTPVALGIATAMHLRSSPKLTVIVVWTSVVFLAFLILITLSDYLSRPWLPIYGK